LLFLHPIRQADWDDPTLKEAALKLGAVNMRTDMNLEQKNGAMRWMTPPKPSAI
jgi:hypothetical protein